MSEYTPTTDEVRGVWSAWVNYGGIANAPSFLSTKEALRALDRWLAVEKAKWQAEALRDAAGYIRDQIGEVGVDSDFNERFEVGGAPYVDRWLMERAYAVEEDHS